MREFLWNYFSSTGDIESYLLWKDHYRLLADKEETEQEMDMEEVQS
ncbi:MAG: YqzL family protein [Bacillaceae bacterium]|nr:YqzL family protein [Bacillaceae bacterium]